MSPIFSTFLFAAVAIADTTTSFWMPGGYSADEVGFYGSVVGVENDRTTIALEYDNETDTSYYDYYDSSPETITLAGTTYFEAVTTSTDAYEDGAMTVSVGCSMTGNGNRARPICTMSTGGNLAYENYCEYYEDYTNLYTSTYLYTYTADEFGPGSTETYIKTYDYSTYVPNYCKSGSSLPQSLALYTTTLRRSSIETYQLIITAGEEKLAATAGATATGSGATATGSGATGSGATATGTGAAAAAGTGAAAPMRTMAPALAGAAVAMAAFVL